jgi:hypothetical protein
MVVKMAVQQRAIHIQQHGIYVMPVQVHGAFIYHFSQKSKQYKKRRARRPALPFRHAKDRAHYHHQTAFWSRSATHSLMID